MLWYSLEASHRGPSNKYPQPMFSQKNIMWTPLHIWSYVYALNEV